MARLPGYVRLLVMLSEDGHRTVSSGQLATLAGVNAAKLRRDLSHLGNYGTRGVGYDVDFLLHQMRQALGLHRPWPVVVVGAGNLGRALAGDEGFGERGFPVIGLLDVDPERAGTRVGAFRVRPLGDLRELARGHRNLIGVIATPPEAAQDVADRLVAAGVTAILSFAPSAVNVSDTVAVRKVDLALELQILAFQQRHRAGRHRGTEAVG